MRRRPNLLAVALALVTLTGLVGMMVVDGPWDAVFLIVAVSPLAGGGIAWWRGRARGPGWR